MDTLPTPYNPIPATRFDGWTPARQWGFLQALADGGSVSQAARSVGMSATAAYRLRRHPAAEAFRVAWDAALVDTLRRVEENTIERILHGEIETIERTGEHVVERITRHRPCAPQVAIAMLARCERLADAAARAAAARADLVRAEAAAAEAAAAFRRRIDGAPPPGPTPVKEPRSPETEALARLHDTLAALPDSRGWEGPAQIGDAETEAWNDARTAVPILPMPPVALAPASARHTPASSRTRIFDPVLRAEKAAASATARAEEAAVMAEMRLRGEAISRIERRKLCDSWGRIYGPEYG